MGPGCLPRGQNWRQREGKPIRSYLQPREFSASLFVLEGIESGLFNSWAWQHCVLAVCYHYSVECSTAVCVCMCQVSGWFPVQQRHCMCAALTFVGTRENFMVDPLLVEGVCLKSNPKPI